MSNKIYIYIYIYIYMCVCVFICVYSGLYVCKLEAMNIKLVQKMTLGRGGGEREREREK